VVRIHLFHLQPEFRRGANDDDTNSNTNGGTEKPPDTRRKQSTAFCALPACSSLAFKLVFLNQLLPA
jgi:hypothetical protein